MKKIYILISFLAIVSWVVPGLAQQKLHSKGKFNFLRGRQAFKNKDYQTALKEFKAYNRLDNKNHQALNFLAQSHHKLKQTKSAEKYYKEAIDNAPKQFAALYQFNLGVLHYDKKKYAKALPYLKAAADGLGEIPKSFAEKKGLAYYYTAFANFEKKRWAAAIAYFAESRKYSKKLSQGAWFYTGISHYKLGKVNAAKSAFRMAGKIGTSPLLNKYSKQFISRLTGYKPKSRFGLTSSIQTTYDTNILLKPDEGFTAGTIGDAKGTLLAVMAEPTYTSKFPFWNMRFKGKYNGSYGYHTETKHRKSDYYTHGFNGIFTKDFKGKHGNRLTFDLGASTLFNSDHEKIRLSFGPSFRYYKGWSGNFATDFNVKGQLSDFKTAISDATDRDGYYANWGGTGIWNMAKNNMIVRVGANGSYSDTDGDDYDGWGFGGNVGATYQFSKSLNASLGFSYKHDQYDDATPSKRRQKTQTLSMSLFKNWKKGSFFKFWPKNLSTSLQYSYTRGKGNGMALDYTRNIFSFAMSHQL